MISPKEHSAYFCACFFDNSSQVTVKPQFFIKLFVLFFIVGTAFEMLFGNTDRFYRILNIVHVVELEFRFLYFRGQLAEIGKERYINVFWILIIAQKNAVSELMLGKF